MAFELDQAGCSIIFMFTNIAKGHPRTEMDKMLDDIKEKNGYKLDTQVTVEIGRAHV